MESYVPFQVILAAVVGANVIPFSENTTQPSSTSTPEDKLVIGFSNDRGQTRKLEICSGDIPGANLSSLTNWLEYIDQLKLFLEEMKSNSTGYEYKDAAMADLRRSKYEDDPPPERIDESIRMIEEFEQKIETELRKPEKDWNYSVEKIARAEHSSE